MNTEMRLMTPKQVAQELMIKPGTVYNWIWKRKIPFIRLSNRLVRIRAEVIEDMIKNGEVTFERDVTP